MKFYPEVKSQTGLIHFGFHVNVLLRNLNLVISANFVLLVLRCAGVGVFWLKSNNAYLQTVQGYSLDTFTLLFNDNSSISTVLWEEEIAFFRMGGFLRLLEEKLQPLDVENLRYILEDSLTGQLPS